jgi:hypothetical protein
LIEEVDDHVCSCRPINACWTQQCTGSLMVKSVGILDLVADWGLKLLSRRGDPVNNSSIQLFCVISVSSINTLLDLGKS